MTAALGLGGAFLALLGVLAVALLRNTRSSPEQRTADAAAITAFSTGYSSFVSDLQAERTARLAEADELRRLVEEQRVDNIRAYEEAAHARRDASAAREEVLWLRQTMTSFLHAYVEWLADGALPPPPAVPDALRALLVEVADHEPPLPT